MASIKVNGVAKDVPYQKVSCLGVQAFAAGWEKRQVSCPIGALKKVHL
jgi:hypothetical protein